MNPDRMDEDRPSKSARKRDDLALKDLGESLTRLGPSELDAVPLGDRLREAVLEAGRIRSRSASRRQRQLIGKLMRSADADAIRASLARLGDNDREAALRFHEAERWRDRICSEGASALTELGRKTGECNGALARLVDELAAAPDEARRRGIRRRIFREVHALLAHRGAPESP